MQNESKSFAALYHSGFRGHPRPARTTLVKSEAVANPTCHFLGRVILGFNSVGGRYVYEHCLYLNAARFLSNRPAKIYMPLLGPQKSELCVWEFKAVRDDYACFIHAFLCKKARTRTRGVWFLHDSKKMRKFKNEEVLYTVTSEKSRVLISTAHDRAFLPPN